MQKTNFGLNGVNFIFGSVKVSVLEKIGEKGRGGGIGET